jgi:hypothetical protein
MIAQESGLIIGIAFQIQIIFRMPVYKGSFYGAARQLYATYNLAISSIYFWNIVLVNTVILNISIIMGSIGSPVKPMPPFLNCEFPDGVAEMSFFPGFMSLNNSIPPAKTIKEFGLEPKAHLATHPYSSS